MPYISLDMDEAYPVYFFGSPSSSSEDKFFVEEEVLIRWRETIAAYNRTQTEMAAVMCHQSVGHEFIEARPYPARRYCKHCYVDDGETPWQ